MDFIPCITWIKQGVAKAVPEKVQLTKEELLALMNEARDNLKEIEGNDEMKTELDEEKDIEARYDMDNYDDDDKEVGKNLLGMTEFLNNDEDPVLVVKDQDDELEEEEKDDFCIRPNDNLIAVGHVDDDHSILEVYVYNEEEGHLYVHHDIVLPAFPLALEWLGFDPSEKNPGNFLAIGDMTPVIQVWDLDLVDTLEPVFELGHKPKKRLVKKKKSKGLSHKDSVLTLSWNQYQTHILASGSADESIILWDLSEAKGVSELKHHSEKVQTIIWHPCESEILLTGACDHQVNLFDCRILESKSSWKLKSDIEKLLWNHFNPFHFYVGCDDGTLSYYDVRSPIPLYSIQAHPKSITDMSLSSSCPGCLITVSIDKTMSIWDVAGDSPQMVLQKDHSLGPLYAVSSCPDAPFVVALGGENKVHNFKVWDIRNNELALERFQGRSLVKSEKPDTLSCSRTEENFTPRDVRAKTEKSPHLTVASLQEDLKMETDAATLELNRLSLDISAGASNQGNVTKAPSKRKKNKKKF